MGLASTTLTRVTKDDANRFMRDFEHLGNVGLGVWHYGLLMDGALQSVLSVGVPCSSRGRGALAATAERNDARLLQLCRGGTSTTAPRNTGSRVIALMLEAVESEFGPSLLAAYADPHFGEVGTIYQACNAVHTGWTDPKGQANYVIQGRRMSGWTVRKKFGTRDVARLREIDPQLVVERLRPKMRYVLVAASGTPRRALMRDLEPLRRPYPKREDLGIRSMMVGIGARSAAGLPDDVVPAHVGALGLGFAVS